MGIAGIMRLRLGRILSSMIGIVLLLGTAAGVALAESDEDLAQRLNNPITTPVSVPFVFYYDRGIGQEDKGSAVRMKIEPVAPFVLSPDWMVISRSSLPVAYEEDVFPDAGRKFGIGDFMTSLFFAPAKKDEGIF